jgi:hypothetical protein
MIKTTIDNPEPERCENAVLAVALALAVALSVGMILLVLIGHVRAEPVTTFRDNMGRVQGYATKHGNTTTYEDRMGQQTGRAERRPDGTTNFYDSMGRMIGSSKDRR